MIPSDFLQANTTYKPPLDIQEGQCSPVRAYVGTMDRGPLEGCDVVVVAWRPSQEEMVQIASGAPIYISIIGNGLPPHMLTTTFEDAVRSA